MQAVKTIGLDIAKSIFQVHGVVADGQAVIRRQLKRRHVLAFFQKLAPCLVGMEACATSHHWSRELQALVSLPPLECCFGTSPIQAEKSRPDRNTFGSAMLATSAVAST
jgi:hypothetical protein